MISVAELKNYLRISEPTAEDAYLLRLIDLADAYLRGAVGAGYDADDERAKQVALLVCSDMYDRRSQETSQKTDGVVGRLVTDYLTQLRMEQSARGREAIEE